MTTLPMRRNLKKISLLVITLVMAVFSDSLHGQISREELKAVYVERICRFIEWPDENRADKSSNGTETRADKTPFVIGFTGEVAIKNAFNKVFATVSINNRSVILREFSVEDQFFDCQILFIGKMNPQVLLGILQKVKNKPILTMSDYPGNCHLGVGVNFYIKKQRLKFEINQASLEAAGLKTDNLLLQYGDVIALNEDNYK